MRLKGQLVSVKVDAQERQFIVYVQGRRLKEVPIKQLYGRQIAFQDYLAAILNEARVEWRRLVIEHRV